MEPDEGKESQRHDASGVGLRSSKTKPIVMKRKQRNVGKTTKRVRTKALASNKSSTGLPSFHNRRQHPPPVTSKDNREREADDDSDDNIEDEYIPSEVLVAIHSIIQTDHGLAVPLNNQITVQAVLEHQIYSTFDHHNATNIHRDLLELVHTNKVRQIYCQDKSNFAYLLTEDYIQAVCDAFSTRQIEGLQVLPSQDKNEEIISWFVSNLHHWTGRNVAQSAMELQWEAYCEEGNQRKSGKTPKENSTATIFQDVLQLLLDLHLLIRDTQQSTLNNHQEHQFYLWLPQWSIVLKAWDDARKQLKAILARAKETSKMNLLRKNRHSFISTHFLLQDLIYNGQVSVIERPFGSFIRLVKD